MSDDLSTGAALAFTPAELMAYLEEVYPVAVSTGVELAELSTDRVVVQYLAHSRDLRPGDTVSGPTFMWLVDLAAYLAVLARIGRVALAVTSSLEIHFLRKAPRGQLRAEARILKLGRRLAVTTAEVFAEHDPRPVAHATITYAIPGTVPTSDVATQ
ncbi:MAG: PaaI family thioesterase [Myxococcales bacterium]|nr:PaaI family thioesterase [Myxococcales bacterium]